MRRISQILLTILVVIFTITILNASTIVTDRGELEYLAFAEEMPAPEGGMGTIIKQIVYPEIARKTSIQGRVYILAYIDEQGNCIDAKVIKGIGGGCDEAACEAVKKVKFTPGKNKGVAVKVKLSLPIEFKLS